jgi:hypothetical protein
MNAEATAACAASQPPDGAPTTPPVQNRPLRGGRRAAPPRRWRMPARATSVSPSGQRGLRRRPWFRSRQGVLPRRDGFASTARAGERLPRLGGHKPAASGSPRPSLASERRREAVPLALGLMRLPHCAGPASTRPERRPSPAHATVPPRPLRACRPRPFQYRDDADSSHRRRCWSARAGAGGVAAAGASV